MWNDDNAIYDDGEWITWTEINSHLERLEFEARYPHFNVELVPVFQSLLAVARDLGELYGAIVYKIKLHRNYAQGSDGRLGNHFVEVKTITPFKSSNAVTISLKRNFSKVLIVKVDEDFEVYGKLIDRKALPRTKGDRLVLDWNDFEGDGRRDARLAGSCMLT